MVTDSRCPNRDKLKSKSPTRSFLTNKLILLLIFVVLPMFLLTFIVSSTAILGYQHDTNPEGFRKTISEAFGIQPVAHNIALPSETIPLPSGNGTVVKAKISHYWPPLGGTNCSNFVNGECISRMASGEPWQKWVGQAVACAPEYPFGTKFVVMGKVYTCMDRGGAIRTITEWISGILTRATWLDLLQDTAPVPYGTIIDVVVYASDTSVGPVSPPPETSYTSYDSYYTLEAGGFWQKGALEWLKFFGLLSDDLLAYGNANAIPAPDSLPAIAACNDPTIPCVFPLERGRDAYIKGEAANGGKDCHTGGGPSMIMGWDWWTQDKSSGSLVYATHNGFVDWSGFDGVGNSIIQISNESWVTSYLHLEEMYVRTGDKINQGQTIGKMGNVGQSDWPHLHYSIFNKDTGPVCNQDFFFPQKGSPGQTNQ